MMFGGSKVLQQERYVALDKGKNQIQQQAQGLGELKLFNNKVAVQEILEKYPQARPLSP